MELILKQFTTLKSSLLCALVTLLLFQSATVAQPIEQQASLKQHVNSLNELTERRRVNTFFSNQQPLQYGLQKGYVNTSRGNLTFVRRDMVVVGRVPIVMARVYDSSRADSADFSPGWYLSLAETINKLPNGNLLYTDDSAATSTILAANTGYEVTQSEVTNITSIVLTSDLKLRIDLLSGWHKIFEQVDDNYRLTSVNDVYGNSLKLSYDGSKLVRISSENGHYVNIGRDDNGRIVKISDENSRNVTYQYKKGQLSSHTDLGGNQWFYQYYGDAQLKSMTDSQGNIAGRFKYDNKHRVTKSTVRGIRHQYHYRTNTTLVTDSLKNETAFEYNALGITTSVTNAQGLTSTITLNKNQQPNTLSHDGKLTASFTYNTNGKLQSLQRQKQDGTFELLTYRYDANDQLSKVAVDENVVYQSTLDINGKPLRLFSDGIQRLYKYNLKGDVISHIEGEVNRAFRYNDDGLLIELIENEAKATFTYNKIGRLTSLTFPDGSQHHYQYDRLGFRSQTIRSDGSELAYRYDQVGNLQGLHSVDALGDTQQKDILLNQANQPTQFIVDGRQALDITYSNSGNPTTVVYSGHSVNYGYDNLNRLIKVDEGSDKVLTYDYKEDETDLRIQLDDRTSKTKTTDAKISRSIITADSLYTRREGTVWQHVVWDENIARLMLPTAYGVVEADSHFKSSFERRRLYNATAKTNKKQRLFDKPSNSSYIPIEYSAVNCPPVDCWLVGVILAGPSESSEGDLVRFYANPILAAAECYPNYSFYVDGHFQTTNTSGIFDYKANNEGTRAIEVASICGFCPLASRQSAFLSLRVKTNQGASCQATGRTLDEIEADYRQMINGARLFQWLVAADNMERFLIVPNSDITISPMWLQSFGVVQDAIEKNVGRVKSKIQHVLDVLEPGQTFQLNEHWDASLEGSALTELFYASGGSTLVTTSIFTIKKHAKGTVEVLGKIIHSWNDAYDWHLGLVAPIPGFGIVEDAEAICLINAGRASEFKMFSGWTVQYSTWPFATALVLHQEVKNEK
jgi:YD repeat-containing protein